MLNNKSNPKSKWGILNLKVPQLKEWGASMITIHGRSKDQRYTKSADWEYIRQVAINASPIPVFGSGDVLSYEDYKNAR